MSLTTVNANVIHTAAMTFGKGRKVYPKQIYTVLTRLFNKSYYDKKLWL